MMKKTLALLLSLVLLCACGASLAEAIPEVVIYELPFEPVTYPLGESGYTYQMPADWVSLELSEDDLAFGVAGRFENPEKTLLVEVALEQLTENVSWEELAELMKGWTGYSQVQPFTVNDEPYIGCQWQEGDVDWTCNIAYVSDEMLETPLLVWFKLIIPDSIRNDENKELFTGMASTVAVMEYTEE